MSLKQVIDLNITVHKGQALMRILVSFWLFIIRRCGNKEETLTVINVYCPRADPEKPERKQFKLQFYKLLQCRAEAVLKDGG